MSATDLEARRAIRDDLDATLVVEAAAGTGKTTEMIARVIAVIRSGRTTLERIVAVTFTEKAAGEMKLRLRTELERARNATPLDRTDERARFEAALAQLEIARVGTIHSFCADVLRERPIEARVDPLFEVAAEDDQERAYGAAFDAWFQAQLAAPTDGVRRMLRRQDPSTLLRDAGASLIERRDFDGPWRRDATFDRAAVVDRAIASLAELGALGARGRETDPLAKLCLRAHRWIEELARREAVRGVRDHDGLEAELVDINRWWEWKGGSPRGDYAAELPRADVIALRERVHAELADAIAASEADLAALLATELRPLVDAYERAKTQAGRLDFLDLLVKTRDLLRDDATVRAELAERFTHFYVDEFQDTDPLQVEILLLLCGEPVAPGKLFVVGDPKQAIYRFRRADVAVYEAIKARLLAGGGRLVHLSTSFRAVPSIQAAINTAFAPVMTGGAGQASYVPLSPAREDTTTQPSLVALPVPAPYSFRGEITKREIEASYPDAAGAFVDWLVTKSGWLVTQRDGTRVPVAARHVCLMFRRFQSWGDDLTRPYVRALEARNLPHVLVGGRAFHEREESGAIRNVLAAIEWPDDELAVYATLRGPFLAFHDEDLFAYKHVHGALDPLAVGYQLSAIGQNEHASPADSRQPTADSPTFAPIADALRFLREVHAQRNRRPIADTLARFLATTRAHAGLAVWPAGEQALANVLRVLDLARRFEARGATSFRAFVDKLAADSERGSKQADATVVEEGTDGVRIMTVHAAKGLEFPVVVLCDPTATLDSRRPSRHIDATTRTWLVPLAGCVPIELRERTPEVLARDREEAIRLAYVAATRARDLLVVPVVGDAEQRSWLDPLSPVVHPDDAAKRTARPAPGCPPFGDDSVATRPPDARAAPFDSVRPGLHVSRTGDHRVVWWDPNVLGLDRADAGGIRQRQILAAADDHARANAAASAAAHAAWQAQKTYALGAGAAHTHPVATATEAARRGIDPSPHLHVDIAHAAVARTDRPTGTRFGALVHAVLAAAPLVDPATDATAAAALAILAESHGRIAGATPAEVTHAIAAAHAALAHPVFARARRATTVRREVPIIITHDGELIEGLVDLAFEDADDGRWIVVELKTEDLRLASPDTLAQYALQVRLYATAIATAARRGVSAVLLGV